MTKEDPFLMTKLFPKDTGLPFAVWMSVRGNAGPEMRVKIEGGDLGVEELVLLRDWTELNRKTLQQHWDGEIDTQEAMEALVKVEVK
jgi:hypothetical protein